MKPLLTLALLVAAAPALAATTAQTARTPDSFIATSQRVVEHLSGDLNNDGRPDHVYVVAGNDSALRHEDPDRGLIDMNPHGLLVALSSPAGYTLALDKPALFGTVFQDGGVYYPPERELDIDKGRLKIHYAHGRYGYWTYTFRQRQGRLQLIGYDASDAEQASISVNLLTGKWLQREPIFHRDAQGGIDYDRPPRSVKETWRTVDNLQPVWLQDIDDLSDYYLPDVLGLYDSAR